MSSGLLYPLLIFFCYFLCAELKNENNYIGIVDTVPTLQSTEEAIEKTNPFFILTDIFGAYV
jgi:hypothetical protein